MMMDTRGLKNVLSTYKNVRTLSLDFGIAKGVIEPGSTKLAFTSVTPQSLPLLTHLVLR